MTTEKEIYVDGKVAAVSDVAAQSIEGRTMVPLRVICEEIFGKTVYSTKFQINRFHAAS